MLAPSSRSFGRARRTLVIACLSLSWRLASPAQAQTAAAPTEEEIAARRVALEEAQRAESSGDHARALDLAERAGRIQMTPSVRRFIAHQQNELRQYARALGTSELCMREIEARGTTIPDREVVLSGCRAEAQRAREHSGRINLQFTPAPPAGTEVRIDGQPISASVVGLPIMASAGTVRIAIRARGFEPFETSAEVHAGAATDVPVALRPAPPVVASPTVSTPPIDEDLAVAPRDNTPVARPRPRLREVSRGPALGPIVLGSVGGALAVGGVVTLIVYAMNAGELTSAPMDRTGCIRVMGDEYECDPSYESTIATAQLTGPLGIGLLVGGVALGAGGLIWGLVSSRPAPAASSNDEDDRAASTRVRVLPWVATTGGGLLIGGSL